MLLKLQNRHKPHTLTQRHQPPRLIIIHRRPARTRPIEAPQHPHALLRTRRAPPVPQHARQQRRDERLHRYDVLARALRLRRVHVERGEPEAARARGAWLDPQRGTTRAEADVGAAQVPARGLGVLVAPLLAEALFTLANLTPEENKREELYSRAQAEAGDEYMLDGEADPDAMELC